MTKTYRKRPVEIQAVQWTGENKEEIYNFVGKDKCLIVEKVKPWYYHYQKTTVLDLIIRTLEGDHHALVGDYIIRGVKGEFYPCKPDIFMQTYEEVT